MSLVRLIYLNIICVWIFFFNTLNSQLNPICHLLALLGAHHILHVSRVRVKHFFLKHLYSKEYWVRYYYTCT